VERIVIGALLSLDGFVQDRHGKLACLSPDLQASGRSEMLREERGKTGAPVVGRRSHDTMLPSSVRETKLGRTQQLPQLRISGPSDVAKGQNDWLSVTFLTTGIHQALAQERGAW